MKDLRFAFGMSAEGIYWTLAPRRRSADSEQALYELWQADVAEAEKLAGRPLNDKELRDGIAHPDPRSRDDRMRAELRRVAELNPRPPAETPAQLRERVAKERLERERLEAMSPVEREYAEATAARAKDDEARAKEAARQAIIQSPDFHTLKKRLDAQLFSARYDMSAPAALAEELEHAAAILDRTLNIEVVRANLNVIQRHRLQNLDTLRSKLRAATDALAAQESSLSDGLHFDSIIDDGSFVTVSKSGKSIKISKSIYDARSSDESLAAELYPATEVTADV